MNNELSDIIRELIEIDAIGMVSFGEHEYTGQLTLNIEIEQNIYNETIVNNILTNTTIPRETTMKDIEDYMEENKEFYI